MLSDYIKAVNVHQRASESDLATLETGQHQLIFLPDSPSAEC